MSSALKPRISAATAGLVGLFAVVVAVLLVKLGVGDAKPSGPSSLYLDHHGVRVAVRALRALASPPVAVVTIVLVALAGLRAGGPRCAVAGLASGGAVAVAAALKAVGPATSLPSGHAAYAAAVFGMGFVLSRSAARLVVPVVLATLIVAVSVARVVEGAHTVADVLAGDVLGLSWLTLVLVASGWPRIGRTRPRRPTRPPGPPVPAGRGGPAPR